MLVGQSPEDKPNTGAHPNHGRVVAVANQKGGVGKTTTAINVAASFGLEGREVLVVDVAPQANLTSGLGFKGQRAPGGTAYEALTTEGAPQSVVLAPRVDHLALVP